MAEQRQDDQLEHTFSNYVRIRDLVQKTWRWRWTIGKSGERGSGISVLPARHDDDDDYSFDRLVGLVGRVFTNGPVNLGSIRGRVIPKTLKMVLDTSLLNVLQYKVRIKGKVEQFRERSSAPLHFGVVAIEKGAFRLPSTKGRQLYLIYFTYYSFPCIAPLYPWYVPYIGES